MLVHLNRENTIFRPELEPRVQGLHQLWTWLTTIEFANRTALMQFGAEVGIKRALVVGKIIHFQ